MAENFRRPDRGADGSPRSGVSAFLGLRVNSATEPDLPRFRIKVDPKPPAPRQDLENCSLAAGRHPTKSLETAFHTPLWPRATASHGFLRKIFPVFSIHLARPGKNSRNGSAILIAVDQSNDKQSCAVKEKANWALPGPKNPQTLTFSVENCNSHPQATETKRLVRFRKIHATAPRVEL